MFKRHLIAWALCLTTAFPASAAKCPTVVIAPGKGSAGKALAQIIKDRTAKEFYLEHSYESLSQTPVEELTSPEIGVDPVNLAYLHNNHISLKVPDTNELFLCTRIAPDYSSFELSDILGRKVYYVVHAHMRGNFFVYRRIDRCPAELKSALLRARDIYPQTFKMPRGETRRFAQDLALKQLTHSQSYRQSGGPRQQKILRSRIDLNEKLLTKLQSKEPITEDDIESWAEMILETQSFDDEDERRSYWVIRGTQKTFTREGVRYRVDLGGAQFTGVHVGNNHHFQAYPAKEVPKRLPEVLARINALNSRSSYEEAVGAYRGFAILHPTIDGTGRVGLGLLDFCLMKAGFPPAPAVHPDMLLTMFVDDSGAAQTLLEAAAAE